MATKFYKQELSNEVLNMVFCVHNILGPGLLESVYEGAIVVELKNSGLPFCCQEVFPVYYKSELIGSYIADIVVDNSIILELKAVKQLNPYMEAQLINYLKISGIPIGYLVNFYRTSVEWKRFICMKE